MLPFEHIAFMAGTTGIFRAGICGAVIARRRDRGTNHPASDEEQKLLT